MVSTREVRNSLSSLQFGDEHAMSTAAELLATLCVEEPKRACEAIIDLNGSVPLLQVVNSCTANATVCDCIKVLRIISGFDHLAGGLVDKEVASPLLKRVDSGSPKLRGEAANCAAILCQHVEVCSVPRNIAPSPL